MSKATIPLPSAVLQPGHLNLSQWLLKATVSSSGASADGYIRGAAESSTTTDNDGHFTDLIHRDGKLISQDGFVVVWEAENQDGDEGGDRGVFMKIYK